MNTKIVVMTSGWILVGKVEDFSEDNSIVFSEAKTIRRWGTTKGIGELASGPTKDTVTDNIPSQTRINGKSVLFSFDAKGWY